eukprot:TRINITY_DN71963_c0_g1_i1.p2 TRINITY_DN71963_c0_g1~~TRINITY_DN71963_c0_g1_i1.p2  ORF type:complete len:113 (-),score=8.22 TRINITY_DN71963_c0_g1_i1:83-421(-)
MNLKREELPFFDLKRQPEMYKHHILHHQPNPQWALVRKWTFVGTITGVFMFWATQKFTHWAYPSTKQRLATMDPEWKRLERERITQTNQDAISKHKIGAPIINNPISATEDL